MKLIIKDSLSKPTNLKLMTVFLLGLLTMFNALANSIFKDEHFTQSDAVLVTDQEGGIVYQWQVDKGLIPASLTKLVTSYLAIEKWGIGHRFKTEFYLSGDQLWVKGYGDPYLISEELDILVTKLKPLLPGQLNSIYIDSSYFKQELAPGSSQVNDPYNAPVSAIAANFNTIKLQRLNGKIISSETQTPLTETAQKMGEQPTSKIGLKPRRINLQNADIAQQYFAELLLKKLNLTNSIIEINQPLPENAELIYQHLSSYDLAGVLQGALKYSNNFIANQLFILLSANDQLDFASAEVTAKTKLLKVFDTDSFNMVDGAGLSRDNQFTANQFDLILARLQPHKKLLKRYKLTNSTAKVFAKTGTLNDVHSFAGFLEVAGHQYQFVFMFNRTMPSNYRINLLENLATQLALSHRVK